MSEWFPPDFGHVSVGSVVSLRGALACDIVKHCALIAAQDNGEDAAGRSRVALMPAADVATRAADIADTLVTLFESRGWIRAITMTLEEEAVRAGELASIKAKREYARISDELNLTPRAKPDPPTR